MKELLDRLISELEDLIEDEQYIDNTPLDAERVKTNLLTGLERIFEGLEDELSDIISESYNNGYEDGYRDGCKNAKGDR